MHLLPILYSLFVKSLHQESVSIHVFIECLVNPSIHPSRLNKLKKSLKILIHLIRSSTCPSRCMNSPCLTFKFLWCHDWHCFSIGQLYRICSIGCQLPCQAVYGAKYLMSFLLSLLPPSQHTHFLLFFFLFLAYSLRCSLQSLTICQQLLKVFGVGVESLLEFMTTFSWN